MISPELESNLQGGFRSAQLNRHEFLTVEHLLLLLLDDAGVHAMLNACSTHIENLRKTLTDFVDEHNPVAAGEERVEPQPTMGFKRVVQRAMLTVQSSHKKEMTGTDVLAAIFAEKESHAVYHLRQHGIAQADVAEYISKRLSKTLSADASKATAQADATSTVAAPSAPTNMSRQLERALRAGFWDATSKRHEFLTVEHLLLILLDDGDAVEALKACSANVEALRKSLVTYIEQHSIVVAEASYEILQPTAGFKRVIERAMMLMQTLCKKEVTGADVLESLYAETESHAVRCLNEQDVLRSELVKFMQR